MKYLLIVFVMMQAAAAVAADIKVQGRTYYGSPSYYSTTESETEVTLHASLPWGTLVYLHHGYAGQKLDQAGGSLDWQGITRTEMKAAAPWSWKARLSKVLHYRSSDVTYSHLQFVVHIIYPDGGTQWLRGTDSRMGFYQVHLLPVEPYAPGSAYPGPMTSLPLEVIER